MHLHLKGAGRSLASLPKRNRGRDPKRDRPLSCGGGERRARGAERASQTPATGFTRRLAPAPPSFFFFLPPPLDVVVLLFGLAVGKESDSAQAPPSLPRPRTARHRPRAGRGGGGERRRVGRKGRSSLVTFFLSLFFFLPPPPPSTLLGGKKKKRRRHFGRREGKARKRSEGEALPVRGAGREGEDATGMGGVFMREIRAGI